MAQIPRLTYFFLGWVGLRLGSSTVSSYLCFPTQHNVVYVANTLVTRSTVVVAIAIVIVTVTIAVTSALTVAV